jgi:hypothetical protein
MFRECCFGPVETHIDKIPRADVVLTVRGCPDCGSARFLETTELATGNRHVTEIKRDDRVAFSGHTGINWDFSDTVGIPCPQCCWADERESWLDAIDHGETASHAA